MLLSDRWYGGINIINANTTQNTITENTTNIVSSIPTFENEIDVNIIDNNTTDENTSNTSNTNTDTNSNTNASNTSSTSTKNNTKKSTASSTKEKNTSTSSKKTSSSSSSTSKSTSSSTKTSSSNKNTSSSGYVWVGNTGHKYHKQTCPTLKGKGHKITLKEALAEGREACKVCY